jgi:hypothetical protein
MEAQVVAGLLEDEGIVFRIPGVDLKDEVAAFQQVANSMGSDILVAEQHLERARAILAEAREAAQGMSDDDFEEDKG